MDLRPLHALRPSEVFEALDTHPRGLSESEADSRRSLYGDNLLSPPPQVPLWRLLLSHLTHLMALVLWGAGLLAIAAGHPALGVVIWIVVLVNAAFSFWQEYRAQQAMQTLSQLLPNYARVVREGEEQRLPASQVVPGDVLVLAEGDNIPADARVFEEFGLRTNNTTLTGEAIPSRKTSDASLRDDLTELEQPNLIFAGTSVVSGTGRAVVFSTGMLTQFGRIVRLTQQIREEPSSLQREMRQLTRRISLIALVVGVIVFFVGLLEVGMPQFEAFFLATGIVVAAVPEGLTATVTLSLAIAVQRLAARGVLVKKLAMVESLGTISVLATDKSGTLTQNQMTIREAWVAGQRIAVSGVGYEPRGTFTPPPGQAGVGPEFEELLTAALLCNNARLNPPTPDHPHWTCLGDQTEAALRVLALKGSLDDDDLARQLPRIHELPFDARRKRMTSLHRTGQGVMAYVKGAPREILQLCTTILQHGEILPLDEQTRNLILAVNDDYARGALRVLALARRQLPRPAGGFAADSVERELTFLGLVAMMDPPRPEVAEAIRCCREAGIRWAMITGDYGLTAESMARRIGMLSTEQPLILTGAELEPMTDTELHRLLAAREVIFARMAPEHKLRLVAAFQALGEVVAVIGDGVNDAPALRKSDVGIVMGVVGTDVAKEAADVIITNDDFGTITTALAEGRAIYDNLRKFTSYTFASNVPELAPFLLTALTGIPLALNVLQILAIDLGTDQLPALALGMEKPEPDVMKRPPRRRSQPILERRLITRAYLWLGPIEATLCFLAFALTYSAFGYGALVRLPPIPWLTRLGAAGLGLAEVHILASTVFFAGVVMSQVGNAFACRTEKGKVRKLGWLSNRYLLLGIGVELVMLLALIYIPFLADLFEMTPLPPHAWPVLAIFAPILIVLERVRKSVALWLERLRHG
jgi:magnesium-transporting ATPase (P-type)